jgi:small subunit ribosomal protein S11
MAEGKSKKEADIKEKAPEEKQVIKEPVKAEETVPVKKKKKKSRKRLVPEGRIYIQASYNNTMVSITDPEGQIIAWSSAGSSGFKGPKKATPFAAQTAAENAVAKAKIFGMERARIFIKGAGNGREQAIRGIQAGGINVEAITDTTAIPHNGCRPSKTRRV